MTSPDHNHPPKEEGFREAELSSEIDVARVHDSILRERAEPADGYEPVPLWMVTLFMAIVFWAGLYLAFNSGGFRSDVFNSANVNWTGAGSGGEKAPPDPMALGKRLFTQNCLVCHQQNGQGVAGQFPPLVQSEWVLSNKDWHGDNHLVKILLHGMQGPMQVQGVTYNGAMPPWSQLKDEQIAYILTYIRNEWGNQAPPITPEYVAKIREQSADRKEPWTQSELQAINRELISEAAAPAPAAPAENAPAPTTPGA